VTDSHEDKPHVASPSLWPIGFAIGLACTLVGLIVSSPVLVVGAVITLVFGFLWVRDLVAKPSVAATTEVDDEAQEAVEEEEEEPEIPVYDRNALLSAATIGISLAIGAVVTLPVLGFAVLPSFESHDLPEIDLGPLSNFPEGEYVIATFFENPSQGDVARRTAFVRNNGFTKDRVPSFTILYSRCVHLGCPVQANGPFQGKPISYRAKDQPEVTLQPVLAASFGCPCHGGQYDGEGNRTAGPPVRSMDRFQFAIRDRNLFLQKIFSVGTVDGTGANAQIQEYTRTYPGVHVDGLEQWLYPIPVPGT
jgi:Rieske Fe-S protein